MIFPFWLHLTHFRRAPVTLMLLAVNVFFFSVLPSNNGSQMPSELARKVSEPDFISVQSYLYENYLRKEHVAEWKTWSQHYYQRRETANSSSSTLQDFWFQLSFRDGVFLQKAKTLEPYPDPIRFHKWMKVMDEFEAHQRNDFSGLFGVSINGFRWSHYLTYQFIHAGFLHLFSNMAILILFGVLIEIQTGSWTVLLLYLLGGAAGGLFYSLTTGNNIAPLVGASGSVSALIAFLLLTEPRSNLRFFFFFFPIEEFFGDIYLSKWWLLPLLILSDVNAVLTMPNWNLAVAHTAHLGAILFGIIFAIGFRLAGRRAHLAETLSWVTHAEEVIPAGEPKFFP